MIAVRQDCRILDYKSAIVIEYDDSERGEGDLGFRSIISARYFIKR